MPTVVATHRVAKMLPLDNRRWILAWFEISSIS
jgi:hypothetical protein